MFFEVLSQFVLKMFKWFVIFQWKKKQHLGSFRYIWHEVLFSRFFVSKSRHKWTRWIGACNSAGLYQELSEKNIVYRVAWNGTVKPLDQCPSKDWWSMFDFNGSAVKTWHLRIWSLKTWCWTLKVGLLVGLPFHGEMYCETLGSRGCSWHNWPATVSKLLYLKF